MGDSLPVLNVELKILEFGHAIIQAKGREITTVDKAEEAPVYVEPETTVVRVIEIIFSGADYLIPKTTSGLL